MYIAMRFIAIVNKTITYKSECKIIRRKEIIPPFFPIGIVNNF